MTPAAIRIPYIYNSISILTCLTGLMRQPRSAVSIARGLDRHLLLDAVAMWSPCGIVIGRHPLGRTAGVEPSRLQHSNALPSPVSCKYHAVIQRVRKSVAIKMMFVLCASYRAIRVFENLYYRPVDPITGTRKIYTCPRVNSTTDRVLSNIKYKVLKTRVFIFLC